MTSLKANFRLVFVRDQQEVEKKIRCSHRDVIVFADGIQIGTKADVAIWIYDEITSRFRLQMIRTGKTIHPAIQS